MVSPQARRRNTIYFILLAGLLAIIWASYAAFNSNHTSSRPEKSLSALLSALDDDKVASATLTTDGDRVDWTDVDGHQYRTLLPGGYVGYIVNRLHDNHRPIDVTESSQPNVLLSVVLPNLILFLVMGGFMWYMLRLTRQKAA